MSNTTHEITIERNVATYSVYRDGEYVGWIEPYRDIVLGLVESYGYEVQLPNGQTASGNFQVSTLRPVRSTLAATKRTVKAVAAADSLAQAKDIVTREKTKVGA